MHNEGTTNKPRGRDPVRALLKDINSQLRPIDKGIFFKEQLIYLEKPVDSAKKKSKTKSDTESAPPFAVETMMNFLFGYEYDKHSRRLKYNPNYNDVKPLLQAWLVNDSEGFGTAVTAILKKHSNVKGITVVTRQQFTKAFFNLFPAEVLLQKASLLKDEEVRQTSVVDQVANKVLNKLYQAQQKVQDVSSFYRHHNHNKAHKNPETSAVALPIINEEEKPGPESQTPSTRTKKGSKT